jgi:molecular chaperone DnaK
MRDAFYRSHGFEVGNDPVVLQRMREAAETAKIELSAANEAEILLPFLAGDESGPRHLEMSLTRARFERAIEPLVDQCLRCVREALSDAGIAVGAADEVLLVGGSTKIPLVQQKIAELFGKSPRKGINADEAVAIGAAIQAALLAGEIDDLLLLDVLPLSLGIAEGDNFAPILLRNTPIPTFRTERFSTVRDFQNSVRIRVYQGDHATARDNRLVGTFRLENLPPQRAGGITIEVTFQVDANGLLQVSARDARTSRISTIDVRDTMRLSDDQIAELAASLESQPLDDAVV